MTRINTPQQNHLLAAFPAGSQERLFPHLTLVHFPAGEIHSEFGPSLRHVYFPIDSLVSLLYMTESGASVEVSLVGKEGLVGTQVFMGGESAPTLALVLNAGYFYRLSETRLKDEFDNNLELRTLLLRYMQASITQMAQTAACNRHHSIGQQLCRWLLLSLDRMPNNRLATTQELIAKMLGVRRESVSEAARKLQKLGVIEYKRGQITVLNRPELENLSCECYAAVKQETDRLQAGQTSPQAR